MSVIYRLILVAISRVILLVAVMPAAAFVKAGTAKLLGDDTPKSQGRLSLDFRRHTDRTGMLITLITGMGWSKEMNYDVSKLKRMKLDVTLISLSAPFAYFFMYLLLYNISGALYGLAPSSFLMASLFRVLRAAAYSGLCFGVIDLLPLPPLDGFQIFYQFSWPKFRRWYFSHYKKIMYWSNIILWGIIFIELITDGEISVIGVIVTQFKRLLDHLVFCHAPWDIPEKIVKVVFGENWFYFVD